MESEDSANEEDVSMKLLSNKGEVPDYQSGGNLDVTYNESEEFLHISDTDEYKALREELEEEHIKVLQSFPK